MVKKWQHNWLYVFHFSVEAVLLFLMILPLYTIHGVQPPTITFIVYVLIAVSIFLVIIFKFNSKKTGLFTIPLIALLGLLVGFHYLLAFLIAGYMFWRLIKVLEDDNEPWNIFLITLTIGLVYYLFFYYLQSRELFILIIVVQFILVTSLKLFKFSSFVRGENSKSFVIQKWQLGSLLLLSSMGVIGWLIFPLVNKLFSLFVQIVFFLFYIVGYPVFYLISFYEKNPLETEDQAAGEVELGDPLEELREFPVFETVALIGQIFLWVVGVSIFIWVIYKVLKKRRPLRTSSVDTDINHSSFSTDLFNFDSFLKRKKPKNEIRRLLFDLEKTLAKKGNGRKRGQTIEEWFHKIEVDEEIKSVISKTYQQVRYGQKHISKEGLKEYKRCIKAMKSLENEKNK